MTSPVRRPLPASAGAAAPRGSLATSVPTAVAGFPLSDGVTMKATPCRISMHPREPRRGSRARDRAHAPVPPDLLVLRVPAARGLGGNVCHHRSPFCWIASSRVGRRPDRVRGPGRAAPPLRQSRSASSWIHRDVTIRESGALITQLHHRASVRAESRFVVPGVSSANLLWYGVLSKRRN
jgi:hypothetical protein